MIAANGSALANTLALAFVAPGKLDKVGKRTDDD
jgi:hypothetical protein